MLFSLLLVTHAAGFANHANIKTVEDVILWTGTDFTEDFDSIKTKSGRERNILFEMGLNIIEQRAKKGNISDQGILAIYYFDEKKDFKKVFFGAHVAAEQGSLLAMEILKGAYHDGDGVVKDSSECLKWSYLMATLGNEHDQRFLGNLEKKYPNNQENLEGKRRAQNWEKEHREVFFNLNENF